MAAMRNELTASELEALRQDANALMTSGTLHLTEGQIAEINRSMGARNDALIDMLNESMKAMEPDMFPVRRSEINAADQALVERIVALEQRVAQLEATMAKLPGRAFDRPRR